MLMGNEAYADASDPTLATGSDYTAATSTIHCFMGLEGAANLLDEELSQLPPKLRLPLVLCYLDGKTNIEAARLLGCPDGSIANRLSVARAELKKRLLRRGMVLSATLLALLLKDRSASAGVSEELLAETLRGAADHFAHAAQGPG